MKNANTVLVIEPDRVLAKCIMDELRKRGLSSIVVSSASDGIKAADNTYLRAVICELSLPSHSGTEFIYEFRTYKDWGLVPICIYSTVSLPDAITSSSDWKLLEPLQFFYKPDTTLHEVVEYVEAQSS